MSFTSKEIAQIIEKYPQEIEKAIKNTLPRKIAILAKNHFKNNFRQSGFVNGGKQAWKQTMRHSFGSRYTPLTSGTDNLMRSITTSTSPGLAIITNPLPYASIHNEGGDIKVTKKMKGFFWSRAYALGAKDGKLPKELPQEAQMWRCLALSKRTSIHIPQRKFIGESIELNNKIKETINKELYNISNGKTSR